MPSNRERDRILEKLLPGEAMAIDGFLYARDIVEAVAEERMGYKADEGHRPMTAVERIREFDAFTIEQKNRIVETKGMAWYLKYAEEIDRLKQALKSAGGVF